jgi:hypothetical protein
MASNTYIEIINKVLVRLRESTVSAVAETTYSALIGAIVNRVKTEIEDAWLWHALRDTYSLTCVPGTCSYTMTGSGPDAVIINAWNTTQQDQMTPGSVHFFDEKFFGVSTPATGNPTHYVVSGLDSNFDLTIDVWPVPGTAITDALKVNLYKPQAELSATTDVPLVPQVVLVEGALARAIMERGDDGGIAIQSQEQLYRELLSSAVARDIGRDSTELIWEPI